MKKVIFTIAAVTASMFAQAGIFDGKSAQFQYINRDRPVGAPLTLTSDVPTTFQGAFSITLKGDNLVLNFLQNGTFASSGNKFSGFVISDVGDYFADFSSFSIVSNAGIPGLSAENLSFEKNKLVVNWAGKTITKGQGAVLAVTAVPEPQTYALMLAGLAVVAGVTRRRKSA